MDDLAAGGSVKLLKTFRVLIRPTNGAAFCIFRCLLSPPVAPRRPVICRETECKSAAAGDTDRCPRRNEANQVLVFLIRQPRLSSCPSSRQNAYFPSRTSFANNSFFSAHANTRRPRNTTYCTMRCCFVLFLYCHPITANLDLFFVSCISLPHPLIFCATSYLQLHLDSVNVQDFILQQRRSEGRVSDTFVKLQPCFFPSLKFHLDFRCRCPS